MRAMGWLSWRTARLEVIAVLAVALGLAVIALDAARRLAPLSPTGLCLDAFFGGEGSPSGCGYVRTFGQLRFGDAGRVVGFPVTLPWVMGALLGSQVVAREVDRGTATLAWSLSGARLRWLVRRSLLSLFAVVFACAIMTIAVGQVVAARTPWLDPWASFYDAGSWGPTPILAGIAAYTMSLAVGAVTGRQVLALVVSLIVCVGVYAGVSRLGPYGMPDEVLIEPVDGWYGARHDGVAFQRADGAIITETEAREEFDRDFLPGWGPVEREAWARQHFGDDAPPPDDWESYRRAEWLDDNFDRVQLGLNGDRFPEFVLRQSLILGGVAVLGATAAAWVVRRRRPS